MSNTNKITFFLLILLIHPLSIFSVELNELTQTKLIKSLLENNLEIKYQKYSLKIASKFVQKEQAIFESTLTASLNHKNNHTPNTAEQFFDRMYKEDFHERVTSYQAGVKKLLPTGTLVGFDVIIDDIDNDLVAQKYQDKLDKESSSNINFSINQPLLKNFGTESTNAKILMAKCSKNMANQEYKNNLINIVSDALSAYWELYYTTRQYELYKDSLQIAQGLLITNSEMVKEGRMAESELINLKADLRIRNSLLNAAKQKLIASQNRIYSLSGMPHRHSDIDFIPIDKPDYTKVEKILNDNSILKNSFMNNPKYISGLMQLRQLNIQIAYLKNQKLPDLNLKANFSINSLDNRPEDFIENIFNDNHESWSLGLEFKMPLGGGLSMESEFAIANLKKQQTLVRLRTIEVDLENQITTNLKSLYYISKQLANNEENVFFKQKLMDIESKKLEIGKSNTQNLLEKEKELNQAKNSRLRAEVNLELSIIELKKIEGVLLENYGIIIEKDNLKLLGKMKQEITKRYNSYILKTKDKK